MCKLKLLLLFLCQLLGGMQLLYAQKEGNIWYFGINAGLDFNSGSPVALTDGALMTDEGCATICDANGKLLFYTDGIYVWNKQHFQMPNGFGMMGDPSSTNSAIIVPYPTDVTKYYVFTVDNEAQPGGFQYSIVDLTKDNGNGDVVTKNIILQNVICEKLTAVQHGNKKDIWVIVHLWESRKFAAYLITEKGVQSPVYSEVGVHYGGHTDNTVGNLKASPDGKRLASIRHVTGGECQVYDFNRETGKITNPILLSNIDKGYGVEFSPNGKLLYVSSKDVGEIFQYDLSDSDTGSIKYKRYTVASGIGITAALQLAPDKKIYVTKHSSGTIHTIEKPDEKGSKCDFKANSVSLNGKTSTYGLPTFVQSYFNFNIAIDFQGVCFGDVTTFKANANLNPDKWEWDFGDPASGINNTSTQKEPTHIFSAPGKYTVKLLATTFGVTETVTQIVNIYKKPVAALGPDKIICGSAPVDLTAGDAEKYVWSTGETSQMISVNKSGTYWVELKNGSCAVRDTIKIIYVEEKDYKLGSDKTICEGSELELKSSASQGDFTWSTGSNSPSIIITQPGKYWFSTKVQDCTFTDTIEITTIPAPKVDLGKDARMCEGEEYVLDAKNTSAKHLWSTGETTSSIKVKTSGKYWVVVDNGTCKASDTAEIEIIPERAFSLGADTVICEGQQLELKSNIADAVYFWSTGSQEASIKVNKSGKYWLFTIAGTCTKADTIEVKAVPVPVVELGDDRPLCEGEETELFAGNNSANILWNTGETTNSIKVLQPGKYWVNIQAGACIATDTITLNFCPPIVYVPSAFSPDNNGVNDTFFVTNTDVASAELTIYNRWGQCVFQTNNITKGWDGKVGNSLCPSEVYIWMLRYKGKIAPRADYKQLQGALELIR